MIVVDVLENLVEPLRHKCPEVVDRTEVKYLVGCVHRPVVIWHHIIVTVDLINNCK